MRGLGRCSSLLFALFAASCAASALAGCASGRPTLSYYTLSLHLPAAGQDPAQLSLSVNRFWARDPYGQGRMVYRTSPYRVDYYNYQLWASAPPEQVQEWTARYLRAAGLFTRVSTLQEAGGDLELGGLIRRFEEVDDDREKTWDAALSMDLWLMRRGERTTLWYGSYEATQRAQKRNPAAIAAALSRCLEQILERVRREIAPLVLRGGLPEPPEGAAEMRHGPAEIRPAPAPPR